MTFELFSLQPNFCISPLKIENSNSPSSLPLLTKFSRSRSCVGFDLAVMSPPLLGVEDERRSEVSSLPVDCISQNSSGLRERNYLGLSDCSSSSVDSSAASGKNNLNLKATELRLGLPGSQSPEREPELCMRNSGALEKPLFPLVPSRDSQKNIVSGNKRGFYDTIEGFSQSAAGQGKYSGNSGVNVMLSARSSGAQAAMKKDAASTAPREQPRSIMGTNLNQSGAPHINTSQPAAKTQVVGWPPVRSYRTKTLATTSKSNDEVDGKPGTDAIFVKVSMDGAPFLRKVDLRTYSTYGELSTALEKMFGGFTIGRCKSQSTSGRELLSESKLKDLLHGSEYVVTYEDKDGDWMLVGDVPWEMFIDTCKKLKIMKSSDAIGLAPRAMEKSKSRN